MVDGHGAMRELEFHLGGGCAAQGPVGAGGQRVGMGPPLAAAAAALEDFEVEAVDHRVTHAQEIRRCLVGLYGIGRVSFHCTNNYRL